MHWKLCRCNPPATEVRIDLVGPNQSERRLDVGYADDLCAFVPRSAVRDGSWQVRLAFGNQTGFGPASGLVPLTRGAESSKPGKRPLSAPGLTRQPTALEARPAVQERPTPPMAPRGPPPRPPGPPVRASSARQLRQLPASGPYASPRPARGLQTPPPRERRAPDRRHGGSSTPPTPPSSASTPSPLAAPPRRASALPSCPGSPEIKEERNLKMLFLEQALAP